MENNICPNNHQQPIYDNSLNPPRLVGFTQPHIFVYEWVEIDERKVQIKVCSLCGYSDDLIGR